MTAKSPKPPSRLISKSRGINIPSPSGCRRALSENSSCRAIRYWPLPVKSFHACLSPSGKSCIEGFPNAEGTQAKCRVMRPITTQNQYRFITPTVIVCTVLPFNQSGDFEEVQVLLKHHQCTRYK